MFHFTRFNKLGVLMRSTREPAQNILRSDNGKGKGFEAPVEGRGYHQTAGANHFCTIRDKIAGADDMFNDFHVQHTVKRFFTACNKLFDRAVNVIDVNADLLCVGFGGFQRFF